MMFTLRSRPFAGTKARNRPTLEARWRKRQTVGNASRPRLEIEWRDDSLASPNARYAEEHLKLSLTLRHDDRRGFGQGRAAAAALLCPCNRLTRFHCRRVISLQDNEASRFSANEVCSPSFPFISGNIRQRNELPERKYMTKDQFEAQQLFTIPCSAAEYARDYVTVQDSAGFFKTVRRADLETHAKAAQDDAERKQFEADMAEEVAAEMRVREAS